jgi:hypothetical protein
MSIRLLIPMMGIACVSLGCRDAPPQPVVHEKPSVHIRAPGVSVDVEKKSKGGVKVEVAPDRP